MSEVAKDRRWRDRRIYERRLRAIGEFIASQAGHCKILDQRITPDGCMKLREHSDLQNYCKDCPGVYTEKRRIDRRSGEDRREGG